MTTSRELGSRPASYDSFGGDDPVLHAAMHEAMLAELTPEDELFLRALSAGVALVSGALAAGELEELYGVTPEQAMAALSEAEADHVARRAEVASWRAARGLASLGW